MKNSGVGIFIYYLNISTRMSWKEGMDTATHCLHITVDTLKIVGPPIALFLLLLADTYGTYIGLTIGFAEGNPIYEHFNYSGITAHEVFHRLVLAATSATLFLMTEIIARHDQKHKYLWNFILLIFWTVLIGEAFVVYHNLLQTTTAISIK